MTRRKVEEEVPDDLPPDLPEAQSAAPKAAIDVGRFCPTCKREARIHSNIDGVRGYCAYCRTDWAISGPAVPSIPLNPARGLSKQTLLIPDTSLAYEDLEWDEEYKRSKR